MIELPTLLFMTEFWVILGIILILADLFLGSNYILLPIGVACLIIAGLVFLKNNGYLPGFIALDDWQHIGYWFAGLCVASIAILKIYSRSGIRKDEDINKY